MLLNALRKLPVSRLLVPYVAGVLWMPNDLRIFWSIFMLGCWLLMLYRLQEKRLPSAWSVRWMPGVGFSCLWLSLGGLSMALLNQRASMPDTSGSFVAALKMLSPPQMKPKSIQFEAVVEATEGGYQVWKGKHLQLYIRKDSSAACIGVGERILATLQPRLPKAPSTSNEFNYAAWLNRKGICATSYVKEWRTSFPSSVWDVKAQAEKMRHWLLVQFRNAGIKNAEFALVSALVLGQTDLLTAQTKSDFSTTGTTHVLSVSGLHVAVVYAVLAFLLSFFDRFEHWRIPKQLLLVSMLFFYAFLTGLSPSVLRSTFMFSLLAMGKCMHRKSQSLNTVLFSAFILLLWNPGFIYDIGFQLSYLAVFFILVVHPKLVAWWSPSNKLLKYFWEMLCLSLVAQLGTSPLTVYTFHSFPNYFLLNNLVAVPFSSLIIYLALVFLMLCGVPWVGIFLAKLLNASVHFFLQLIETAGHLPYATTGGLHMDGYQVAGVYVVVLAFFFAILLKRRVWFIPFLASILGLQIWTILTTIWF